MKQFNQSVLDIIGNTPIVKLGHVAQNVSSSIYVKLEYLNPGGSVKDRIGYYMCQKAVENGLLKPGGTIIEATSGNTGIGIAMFAAVKNYSAIFVMNDKQSQEKINTLKSYGAKVIVCPTKVDHDDPRSYYSIAKKISESLDNCYYPDQYSNPYNIEAHYKITGPEIFKQTNGEFDAFVAGVGTGGTISGTSKYLKEKMPHLKVIGVDPKGSILHDYYKNKKIIESQSYAIEGIGSSFLAENIKFEFIDQFITVEDKESFLMTRNLLQKEGIYCGGSCGAAVMGAIKYAQGLTKPERILVMLPDSGNRYLSKIYNDQWMSQSHYLAEKKLDQLDDQIKKLLINEVKLI